MSDQPTPPPKPKPGSLRDRIAAFEKPNSGSSGPAPAPRPKPGGFSWKPKAPSPPSSPSAADQTAAVEKKLGGMSASDAKESIGKGGSLKERMAALQNKGAFGASPPLAPKPVLEKPKWKPPPVIAPVDRDEDELSRGESTKSPPLPAVGISEDDLTKEASVEPQSENVEHEDLNNNDPEDEERQRRAAIAARMARLGGARVGMAPVFGKSATKRVEPKEESIAADEVMMPIEDASKESTTEDVPSLQLPAEVSSEGSTTILLDAEPSSDTPQREDSGSPTVLIESDLQASRSPNLMPLPAAPRRAAPPRKKPVKPQSSLPSLPSEEPVESDASGTAHFAETFEAVSTGEKKNLDVDEVGDSEPRIGREDDPAARPFLNISPETIAETPVDEQGLGDVLNEPSPSIGPEVEDLHDIIEKHTEAETWQEHIEDPSYVREADMYTGPASHEGSSDGGKAGEPGSNVPFFTPEATVSIDHEAPLGGAVEQLAYEGDTPVSPEEEEAARRKRVADKLARMGGVNPFALPPQRKESVSSEDAKMPTSPVSPKRGSISAETITSIPPQPRRDSLRKSSIDSTISEQRTSYSPSSIPPVRKDSIGSTVVRRSSVDSNASERRVSQLPLRSQPIKRDSTEYTVAKDQPETSESIAQDRDIDSDRVPNVGGEAAKSIPEESEEFSDVEEVGSEHEEHESNITHPTYRDIEEQQISGSSEQDADHNNSDLPSISPAASPPPVPKSTRPVVKNEAPVDPALPISPVLPHSQVLSHAVSPPGRSLPPPPRLISQLDDTQDASDSEPDVPPKPAKTPDQTSDNEDNVPRPLPPRVLPSEENTDNESPPLPVPHRKSLSQEKPSRQSVGYATRLARPVPAQPPLSTPTSDVESDYDEALPTRPRHRPATPGTPPPNEIPLIVPPPISDESLRKPEPSPLRQSTYPPHERSDSAQLDSLLPSRSTPTLSVSDQEILDEEEGDPIDPGFHIPSRRSSAVNLPFTVSSAAQEPTVEAEEDPEQVRRRTIAERMAKLGGIKFGAAPIPAPISRPPPLAPRAETPTELSEEQTEVFETVGPSEAEEERARKERISAKLAGMGGMRIGMLPLGVGNIRPQQSYVLKDEDLNPALPVPPVPVHAPPTRTLPPSRPPPPQHSQDSDAELSTSQYSLSASSDGVKVEAEESEIEEVSHEDVEEAELPPPVPARALRRGTLESESTHAPVPPTRPPVPTIPIRKPSVPATISSGRKSSVDSNLSPRRASTHKPQSEYVMVEEPKTFTLDDEVPPPPPPHRPMSRAPPPRSAPPPPPTADPSDSISSQWELPSIPTSSLEFGPDADLSLSWTEDPSSELGLPSPPPPPPPHKSTERRVSHAAPPEQQLSADELMAVWGRVGVQLCEVATSLFEKSKKSLVGDGTYAGFVNAALSEVPNAAAESPTSYGYLIYVQSGGSVQKRASEIMPGDIVELHDAKLKGHKGLQTYNQSVGVGEPLLGVVSEFEPKKSKIRVFQANQHVGHQTVEAASYRLEDLKSGTVRVFRVLEA